NARDSQRRKPVDLSGHVSRWPDTGSVAKAVGSALWKSSTPAARARSVSLVAALLRGCLPPSRPSPLAGRRAWSQSRTAVTTAPPLAPSARARVGQPRTFLPAASFLAVRATVLTRIPASSSPAAVTAA